MHVAPIRVLRRPATQAKVLIVVGTRPEVIKMSPVARTLGRVRGVAVSVCLVAQQGEILDQAVAEWQLKPDHRIDLPGSDRRLATTLAAMLPGLADCIEHERPSIVLVQGDTTTNLGAALAAFYAGVPVAHVEAGLRSGDVAHPFPEEMHRVLVDRIASVHYAPTEGARRNLLAENGLDSDHIVVAGNTVVDALFAAAADPADAPLAFPDDRRILLVTAHRRESFGRGIESICRAILQLVTCRSDLHVVFVLHTNPAARLPVEAALSGLPDVQLIEPQPYRAFVRLLAKADIVLTDSGGVQEEAPYLGTPVLVTREVTERPEASEVGLARIVGTDVETIVSAVNDLLDDPRLYAWMSRPATPFGDGQASQLISNDLVRRLLGRVSGDTRRQTEVAEPQITQRVPGPVGMAPVFGQAEPTWEGSVS